MRIIAPDFDRTIDLPGVGPCPRPVDIDQRVTGFSDLVSLRIYSFWDGSVIHGEAEEDEVFIVLLDGAADIEVTGATGAEFRLTIDGTRAVYLPPHHHYRLRPKGGAEVAYARARPGRGSAPAGFEVGSGPDLLFVTGYAERLEMRLVRLEAGGRLDVRTGAAPLPERLVYVRDPARLEGDGMAELGAWHSAALGHGEAATLVATGGEALALVLAAR